MTRIGAERLANAIILKAASDYVTNAKRLIKNPNDSKAISMCEECEKFFLSEYYMMLTSVDGAKILNSLKEQVANGAKKRKYRESNKQIR